MRNLCHRSPEVDPKSGWSWAYCTSCGNDGLMETNPKNIPKYPNISQNHLIFGWRTIAIEAETLGSNFINSSHCTTVGFRCVSAPLCSGSTNSLSPLTGQAQCWNLMLGVRFLLFRNRTLTWSFLFGTAVQGFSLFNQILVSYKFPYDLNCQIASGMKICSIIWRNPGQKTQACKIGNETGGLPTRKDP